MNFHLEATNLVKWLHFVTMSIGAGAAVVALLLSGFEEGREDLQGLAATVWAQVVRWAFRLALLTGIALLLMLILAGNSPLKGGFAFHLKLTLVFILVGLSEMTPKALAEGRRGSALLVLVLFLATGFTMFNRGLFHKEVPKALPGLPATVATSTPVR